MPPRIFGASPLSSSRRSGSWRSPPASRSPSPSHATAPVRVAARRRVRGDGPLKNEIPPEELGRSWRSTSRAWDSWSSTSTRRPSRHFREVHDRAPGWIPGSINLAIALLNDTGVKAEEAKKNGGGRRPPATSTRPWICSPRSWSATRQPPRPFLPGHHPRAAGESRRGPPALQAGDRDRPHDATAWYWLGSTLTDPGRPRSRQPAGPERRPRNRSPCSRKALERDPYLTPAIYKMAMAYAFHRATATSRRELLDRWKKIDPDRPAPTPGPGDSGRQEPTARWASTPASSNPFRGPEPRIEPATDAAEIRSGPAAAGQARARTSAGSSRPISPARWR